jgi:hypothetical protein
LDPATHAQRHTVFTTDNSVDSAAHRSFLSSSLSTPRPFRSRRSIYRYAAALFNSRRANLTPFVIY